MMKKPLLRQDFILKQFLFLCYNKKVSMPYCAFLFGLRPFGG